ncbi:MAG: hypothetical protein QOG72_807 [Sphingomonadales bacterium]|jgi:hypothetical protein|nr:hypothetical protein [Sphingomonadales bacterium]
MAETADTGEYDGYARLRAEIKRRWRAPRGHPTFAIFFIASFLVFAAAGVWLEFFKLVFGWGPEHGSASALRTAIATYFPAILGSTILQLAISDSLRSLRALGHLVGTAFLALAFALVFSGTLLDWAAILIGLAASAASLACWWIVNADEESFRDEPPPQVATGDPDPTAPLLGDDALNQFQL